MKTFTIDENRIKGIKKKKKKEMGLSFHYSGRISNLKALPDLIDEVQEISKIYGWKYYIFEREFPKESFNRWIYDDLTYGITFTPRNCETIYICFLSNGYICDPSRVKLFGNSSDRREREFIFTVSVKTLYAGIEVHKTIIQLFRYLSDKYFSEFKLNDEGLYWETDDEDLLELNFKKYNDFIDAFSLAIESYPIRPGEETEAYILRLLKYMKEKKRS